MKTYIIYLKVVDIRDRNHTSKGYTLVGSIAQHILNAWSWWWQHKPFCNNNNNPK